MTTLDRDLLRVPRRAQAHYRAALALEMLGRTADAVQRAERALNVQSSAAQGSSGQVTALLQRLQSLSASSAGSKTPSARRPAASRADTISSAAGTAGSAAQDFLQTAAPLLSGERACCLWQGR